MEGDKMKRPIQPVSVEGWWAFWLGGFTVVWGILLPVLPQLIRTAIGATPNSVIPIPGGFFSAVLEIVLAVAAILVSIAAFRKGERSWLTLLAFIGTIFVGGFWILFALGEVIFSH
jgi:hypothetical protein